MITNPQTPEFKLGIWAGILSSIFAIAWFILFSLQDKIHAVPEWTNLDLYAEQFNINRLSYIYPSLLLAISYILLLAALHRITPSDKKVWSLAGLSLGIIYATMASINYNIQAVAVRLSLAAGETESLGIFIPDNTHSVFSALANSYIYLSLSMVFTAFIFKKGKLEKWIRYLLLVQLITAIGQAGYTMFDWSEKLFIATSMVWVIGAPIAFILIAIWLSRQLKINDYGETYTN